MRHAEMRTTHECDNCGELAHEPLNEGQNLRCDCGGVLKPAAAKEGEMSCRDCGFAPCACE